MDQEIYYERQCLDIVPDSVVQRFLSALRNCSVWDNLIPMHNLVSCEFSHVVVVPTEPETR